MPGRLNKLRLIIIGASGHGKVVADIASLNGYKNIVFLDDDESVKECGGYPVIGKSSAVDADGVLFVAIGNSEIRKQIMDRYKDMHFPVLIHPNAVIADGVEIGDGTVIMAGAVINSGSKLGKGIIVNTCSSIDHDCKINDFVHIAVGAHLCGTVNVGNGTLIGAGATVINNITICDGCKIGAGATVIKSIEESGTYVGVPARNIKEKYKAF